jgi:hypothetical protein
MSQTNLVPPSVPFDSEYPDLIAISREWYALTAERESEQWQAVALAAGVGAYPVRVVSKRDTDGETTQRQVTDLRLFASGFDRLLTRNNASGQSTIVTLSGAFHRDDCSQTDVAELLPLGFMAIETSEGCFQVWFRLPDRQSDTEGRRQFHALLTAAGIGGNPGATHSARWPGSINGKPSRNGWMVRIVGRDDGRVTTLEEVASSQRPTLTLCPTLTSENAVGAIPERLRVSQRVKYNQSSRRRYPDYERCLAGKPTRSEADASWIRIALDYHFGDDEIVRELARVSERFALLTERQQRQDVARIRAKFAGYAIPYPDGRNTATRQL